ncbi:MAG: hypothetical protein AB7S99_16685 [Pseudodonghicola sp.]
MFDFSRRWRRLPGAYTLRSIRRELRFGKALRTPAPDQIIVGGKGELERYFGLRERPFRNVSAVIPAGRIDLAPMKVNILPEADAPPDREATLDAREKYRSLRLEFAGAPELFAFHAMVIALLRRRDCPPRFGKLFLRIWQEEGPFLADHLPVRWLISSATTFADVGNTPAQRLAGQSLALVFDMIKLHDSERRFSGLPGSVPLPFNFRDDRFPLAFDLPPYSMRTGDLDRSILMRLWRMSQSDPLFRPLGTRMMDLLMTDDRTVFARVQKYKDPNSRSQGPDTATDDQMGGGQHDQG